MNGTYGRPGTKAAQLREWFHAAILRHEAAGTLPTTPKFLIYEAVQAEVIPKAATGARRYDQDAGRSHHLAPRAGPRPLGVDRRPHAAHRRPPRVAERARRRAGRGRGGARWTPGEGQAPLLVVESESLAGLLEPLADTYRIVLVPVRGQAGGAYLVNDVRPYVERGHTEVLYVGDFDKAGADIEDSARARLETHSGRALTVDAARAHRRSRSRRTTSRSSSATTAATGRPERSASARRCRRPSCSTWSRPPSATGCRRRSIAFMNGKRGNAAPCGGG